MAEVSPSLLYGPDRAFHGVCREVAHLADMRLDRKCLSSALPRACVDVVERS
jgi:hypothetical protein